MALRIRVKNPDISQEEITNVSSDYSSGTTLTVQSNDDIAANDYLVVGNPGEEGAELGRVSSITGNTTVTLNATLKFSHATGTPIFRSLYNQIAVERKPSAGAYALIVEGNIEIDFDAPDGFTIVSVAAGATTDTYKWRFYNVASGSYSTYSDELAGTGLTRNSVGYMISEFRVLASVPDHQSLPDEQIIKWFNDCHDRIEANNDRWWFLLTETDNSTTASDYTYGLPSDFARMEAVIFNDGDITFRLHYVPLAEFDQLRIDNSFPDDDTLTYWTLLPPDSTNTKGYVGVFPTPETASLTLTFRYYKEMAVLDSFGDTSLVPFPEVVINYALWRYYQSRENVEQQTVYKTYYLEGIDMIKRMQRREVGESATIKRWLGHRGRSKLFGARVGLYSDTLRENFWN